MTIDNASSIEIHKWFVGQECVPEFRVTWENAVSDNGDYDEQSRGFATLDEALEFGRVLLLVDGWEQG